jgi:hypothetical protein
MGKVVLRMERWQDHISHPWEPGECHFAISEGSSVFDGIAVDTPRDITPKRCRIPLSSLQTTRPSVAHLDRFVTPGVIPCLRFVKELSNFTMVTEQADILFCAQEKIRSKTSRDGLARASLFGTRAGE